MDLKDFSSENKKRYNAIGYSRAFDNVESLLEYLENKMNRAELRGKKLEVFCKEAKTTTNEHGLNDNRVFCYGLNDSSTDSLIHECKDCKAHVNFVDKID